MKAFALALHYGVPISLDDLGDWGACKLYSEYDPNGPAIRVNARVARALPEGERDAFVLAAVGHELYHHRERLGEVRVIVDRAAREAAADAYSRALRDEA
jgi:hypothetical protein